MSTPLLQLDFRVVQGDGVTKGIALTNALDGTPYSIAGYSADFSLRQNYGDPQPLIAMTTSVPSANGSTIAIVAAPGTTGSNATSIVITPADTMLLPPLMAARQAKYYYTWRILNALSVPTTVAVGAWYVTART
jgi:hypothetical protein